MESGLRLRSLFLGLGFLCLLLSGCGPSKEVLLAEELINQGDWDGAVAAYREAVRNDPFNEELRDKLEEVKSQAAEVHYGRGRKALKQNNLPVALQEFQVALGLEPSKPEHQAALAEALRLKEARRALNDAKTLETLGRLEEALTFYERAIELDPNLVEALKRITAVSKQLQAQETIGESTEPVTLRFQNTRLKQVFEILARTANIDILFDKDIRDDLVTIFTRDTPFDQALNLILSTNQLFAKRVAPDTLLIIPDTKQKRQQYQDLKIKTFYLSNAKAKDMANLLRTILETKRVYVNETLNTVVVRDEPAKITLAERVILANDRPDSEVLIDVEILEVTHLENERFGVRFAKQLGFGVFPPGTEEAAGDIPAPLREFTTFPQTWTYEALTSIGQNSYLFRLPSSILLDFLKTESTTKTLANPKLRVLNNQKASINVGDKQPILLSTTNVQPGQAATGAVPTTSTVTSIEFKDTGIKLTVQPTIHLNNSISLTIEIEVVRLGDRVILQTDPLITQFRFGTRTADTTLMLRDGETVILGGLIAEDNRRTREAVPYLDDVPFLGDALSSRIEDLVTTEIILVISPYIVRHVNPSSPAKRTLWSGTTQRFATQPLFSDQGASRTSVSQTNGSQSTVPTPSNPDPMAQPLNPSSSENQKIGETQLALLPSSIDTTLGQEIRVDLKGDDIPPFERSKLTIRYDPKIIQFTKILEGEFWQQKGIPSHLRASSFPDLGQIVLQMGQEGQPTSGGGQLATMIFQAKKSGGTPLEIQDLSLIGPDANRIPVNTQNGRIWVQ